MIEVKFLDIGKEVEVPLAKTSIRKGIITHYNDKHVFVRIYGTDTPKPFKRDVLNWSLSNFQRHNIF